MTASLERDPMLLPAVNIPVSLFLTASTAFCITRISGGKSWVERLNYSFHALMALAMLAMVWHYVNVPLLPQLLLFSIASFWFVLQAVAQPQSVLGCNTRTGRLTSFYHSATLAAMTFMLTLPHSAGAGKQRTVTAEPNNGHASHTGHADIGPVASSSVLEGNALWSQPAAQVLAFAFAVAALAWLLPTGRLMNKRQPRTSLPVGKPSQHHHLGLNRINEAGSALMMSLMFAAIGAKA